MFTQITANSFKRGFVYNYAEFLCDTKDDIDLLPTNQKKKMNDKTCAYGSKALVLDTKDIYILNNKNEWEFYKNISSTCDFGTIFM